MRRQRTATDINVLGQAQLTSNGTATLKLRLGIGSHNIKAKFQGTNLNVASTSSTQSLTVTGTIKTRTDILVDHQTFYGRVTSYGSLPATGTVSFVDAANDQNPFASAPLNAAGVRPLFRSAPYPDLGVNPLSVVAGDFNGDGIPDLAVTDNYYAYSSGVTILLGNGDGTFKTKSTPSVGANPYEIEVGDFNGDGVPDLAVVNAGSCCDYVGTVSILLGNGDGTFTPKSTFRGYTTVAMGDFNGDGILDLVTANGSDNTVTVLLGNGDGTFAVKSHPSVHPGVMGVGDFNGDGIPDLAVVNNLDGTVTALLGNGDGTFTAKSTTSVGSGPLSIVVADFTGDGVPDLATANSDNTVSILLGKGDGTFTTKSTPNVGSISYGMAVGDFNGDGIPDLVVANYDGPYFASQMTILQGNGDGTFFTGTTHSAAGYELAVGDFNGDGLPDVMLANPNGGAQLLLGEVATTAIANNVTVPGSGNASRLRAVSRGWRTFGQQVDNLVGDGDGVGRANF